MKNLKEIKFENEFYKLSEYPYNHPENYQNTLLQYGQNAAIMELAGDHTLAASTLTNANNIMCDTISSLIETTNHNAKHLGNALDKIARNQERLIALITEALERPVELLKVEADWEDIE